MLQAGRGGKSCGDSQITSCARSQAAGYCWETGLFICGFSLPKKGDAWKARKRHSTHNGRKRMRVPRAGEAAGEAPFSA